MPSLHPIFLGSAAKRLGLLIFFLICNSACRRETPPDTTIVTPTATGKVFAQGQLVPANGITQLFALPGDPVDEVHVAVGEEVAEGQPLVTLRSSVLRQTQLATLQQQLAEAERTKASAVAAAELGLKAAELKFSQVEQKQLSVTRQTELLELAEAQVTAGERILNQLEKIAQNKLTKEFVGQLEVDRQRLTVAEARLKYQQQQETQRQIIDELVWARDAALAEKEAAQLQLTAAMDADAAKIIEMQIAGLNIETQSSTINAPTSGTILTINASKGEASVQRPLIEMANTEKLVCEAEVNELDAARVQPTQAAVIRSRAFAEPLRGVVIHKSSLVGRPQLRPLDPLASVDYRAVTVLIELDAQSTAKARPWLQLQVEVEIDTRQE